MSLQDTKPMPHRFCIQKICKILLLKKKVYCEDSNLIFGHKYNKSSYVSILVGYNKVDGEYLLQNISIL